MEGFKHLNREQILLVATTTRVGNWNIRDSTSVTGTFDSARNFTGSRTDANNNGCHYAGIVSVIAAGFNAESATMTVTGCSLADTYSGLAALIDFRSSDDTIVFGLASSDKSTAEASRLTRF
ncbi:hypothetical protein [Aliidongia sp.]|uniref:hypothetical protein n=1 Tax=Aliidongia sp. TaxID=1914230 RepID=UPI002DDD8782|nr:hypothetical protein [Aliidongia sp.]